MSQPISSTIALSLILSLAPITLTNIYLTKVGTTLPRTQYHNNIQHVKSHLNSVDPSTLLPNPAHKPPPTMSQTPNGRWPHRHPQKVPYMIAMAATISASAQFW